jgi:aminoglycoside phosphotransferase (APT) family kinase protein
MHETAVATPRPPWSSRSAVRAGDYLAQVTAHELGRRRVIATPLPCGPLLDAKQTWILRDAGGDACAAAQLSAPRAPKMVARGVARADAIRGALDAERAAPVLSPFASGTFEGASYAVWPFCAPVRMRGGVRIGGRRFVRPLLAWLREVTRQTARAIASDAVGAQVDRNLCRMAMDARLSAHARLCARRALDRLDRGRFRPTHVAMHGDLHVGNVLIDDCDATGRAELPMVDRFAIIDWCGASREGYPIFDLLRLADSMRVSDARLAVELARHCELLGGDLDDAASHTAAGLADLGAHLECFPVAAYSALIDRVLRRLESALSHHGGRASS